MILAFILTTDSIGKSDKSQIWSCSTFSVVLVVAVDLVFNSWSFILEFLDLTNNFRCWPLCLFE